MQKQLQGHTSRPRLADWSTQPMHDAAPPAYQPLSCPCSVAAPQIARRRKAHQEKHPDAKIISLGEALG